MKKNSFTNHNKKKLLISSLILLIVFSLPLFADKNRLIIASTTSVYDTGLLPYLNKKFSKLHDVKVHTIALGTGQAIEIAKKGNADILLIHHTPSEINFVNNGYGLTRYDLMYNDYIIVGPKEFRISCNNLKEVLYTIKKNKYIFLSRGDDSGTHKKEKELWGLLNFNPKIFSNWYKKIGQGMGGTLMMANEIKAFTLTDRSTWISYNNKKNLKIICENNPSLLNQYGIIPVNPKINANINYSIADIYIKWIISEKGKKLINSFKKNGQNLFIFNYK